MPRGGGVSTKSAFSGAVSNVVDPNKPMVDINEEANSRGGGPVGRDFGDRSAGLDAASGGAVNNGVNNGVSGGASGGGASGGLGRFGRGGRFAGASGGPRIDGSRFQGANSFNNNQQENSTDNQNAEPGDGAEQKPPVNSFGGGFSGLPFGQKPPPAPEPPQNVGGFASREFGGRGGGGFRGGRGGGGRGGDRGGGRGGGRGGSFGSGFRGAQSAGGGDGGNNFATGANADNSFGGGRRPYANAFNRDRDGGRPNRFNAGTVDNFGDRRGGGGNFGRPPSRQFATEEEREREQSHVPKGRTVAEIYQEDEQCADRYENIREEDDNVDIEGLALGPAADENGEAQQPEVAVVVDKWSEAGFDAKILANIERSKYVVPRKIQSRAIPIIAEGRDLKAQAETGSGKSAAFLLPLIDMIMKKKASGEYKYKRAAPFAMIVEPTRELVIQLWEQGIKLANETGVTIAKAYGKYRLNENIREIDIGCDILIGTIGRLIHLFNGTQGQFQMNNAQSQPKFCHTDNLKVFVLDEADQLLDSETSRELERLIAVEGFPKPDDRQTLMFSATFPPEVQRWADGWMRANCVFVSNHKANLANGRITQNFELVSHMEKNSKLVDVIMAHVLKPAEAVDSTQSTDAEKQPAATDGLKKDADGEYYQIPRTMVFVKEKRKCDTTALLLNNRKIRATSINSDRPQAVREISLTKFRKGEKHVVVCTDVCARGLDIKEMDLVINFDLPDTITTYIHRIGRTGRLGEGKSVSLFDPISDMDLASELARVVGDTGVEVPQWLTDAANGKLNWVPPSQGALVGLGSGIGGAFAARNASTTENTTQEAASADAAAKPPEDANKDDTDDSGADVTAGVTPEPLFNFAKPTTPSSVPRPPIVIPKAVNDDEDWDN